MYPVVFLLAYGLPVCARMAGAWGGSPFAVLRVHSSSRLSEPGKSQDSKSYGQIFRKFYI